MSGRDLFRLMRPFIFITKGLFYLLPFWLKMFLWRISDSFGVYFSNFIKYLVLSTTIKKCGKNIYIGRNVTIKSMKNLSVGDNVSIHDCCYLDCIGSIEIGDNVSIAHNSSILAFDHLWDQIDIPIKYNKLKYGPIKIANDVWIGCGCRILSGVTLYNRTIVAAGAVVTKSFKPRIILGGVSAKIIKEI